MMLKTLTSFAAAAGFLTMAAAIPSVQAQMTPGGQPVTNGPQTSGIEHSGGWSAHRNVVDSQRYERLVESNGAFRHARMGKECGPITDPQLHANCVASFDQNEATMSGSSTEPRHYRSSYGR